MYFRGYKTEFEERSKSASMQDHCFPLRGAAKKEKKKKKCHIQDVVCMFLRHNFQQQTIQGTTIASSRA